MGYLKIATNLVRCRPLEAEPKLDVAIGEAVYALRRAVNREKHYKSLLRECTRYLEGDGHREVCECRRCQLCRRVQKELEDK